jgi:hypothetical protein
MFVEEVYVEIPDYPNYAVSNYGCVVNVNTNIELKAWEVNGKLMVKLYAKGQPKNFFVHRLVAQAFFVDYDDYVDVWHLSEDKHDNCISNLHLVDPYWARWV